MEIDRHRLKGSGIATRIDSQPVVFLDFRSEVAVRERSAQTRGKPDDRVARDGPVTPVLQVADRARDGHLFEPKSSRSRL